MVENMLPLDLVLPLMVAFSPTQSLLNIGFLFTFYLPSSVHHGLLRIPFCKSPPALPTLLFYAISAVAPFKEKLVTLF